MSSSPTAEPAGTPGSTGDVVVGRIGRAHGIGGEVSVGLLTDAPGLRFAVGATLRARLPGGGTRTVVVGSARPHAERLLVGFAGIGDRTAAEALAGSLLLAQPGPVETGDDPDEFFDYQLIGSTAESRAGTVLGEVTDVLHNGAQDLLVVAPAGGGDDVLVPFVAAIVVAVDPAGARLTLDPPGGLF